MRFARLGLVLLALAGLSFQLGSHPLIDPDEGRNASVAREMADSGDFLLPTLDGLPYLDKPFLFFAFSALSIRLLGATELAARLPSLLFAWATVALTAWFAARLFGRRAAWVAAIATATSPLMIAFARTVIFDAMLSFFMTLALICFYLAVESRGDPAGSDYRTWTALAWLAMAFGVFTKGPVALLVPLLVAAPYAIRRSASAAVWHPAGGSVFLAVSIPWLWAVEAKVPGFLHYALVTETWQRVTTDQMARTGPVWYFLPYLLGGAFPWILIALAACRGHWREIRGGARDSPLFFLALWILLPLIFFSLSQSKRPHYILPLIPAIALLAAWAWAGRPSPLPGVRAAACGWLLLAGAFLASSMVIPSRVEAELVTGAVSTARWLAAGTLAAALAAWFAARHRTAAVCALAVPLTLLPAATAPLLHQIATQRSGKALAAALTSRLPATTRVAGLETFSPSLGFYLDRPVHLASATAGPLGSNYIIRSYLSWVDAGTSPLHSHDWWWRALGSCDVPTVFIVQPKFADHRATLEETGLPLFFAGRRLAAYGPCARHEEAETPPAAPG